MNHRKTRILLLLAILLRGVSAFATNYYVNNSTGSDSNSGTSSGSPWATFNHVNSHTFSAGDTINLACGCIWNQEMDLAGTGNSSNWITVTSYGTGNRPAILRDGLTQGPSAAATERCIVLTNSDYWSFNNLEVGYAGVGLIVEFTTISHQGLNFNNIYAHDCAGIGKGSGLGNFEYLGESAGIALCGNTTLTASQYVISGISFSNIQGTHNGDTIRVGIGGSMSDGSDGHTIAQNITCTNLYFHGDDADGVSNDSTSGFCVSYCENVTIMDSILNDECGGSSPTGTAATYCAVVQNLHLINCVIENTPFTSQHDMTGWDSEGYLTNLNFEGDYFTGNAGPGLEFLCIHGSTAQNNQNSVLSSMFVNNGAAGPGWGGGLTVVGGNVVPTGTVDNNLYWEPNGFTTTNSGGTWSGFTFSNNLPAVQQADVYNAGTGFSGTQGGGQWSYQIWNGSAWSNMTTYNSASPAFWSSWGANSNADLIWSQALLPDSNNSLISRAWNAPFSGQISIRGWAALAPGQPPGSGDLISITKNGASIFGSTVVSNTTGFATNADVTVNPGDVIRFQVTDNGAGNNTGDLLSWAPNIAYTSGGGGGTTYKIVNLNSGLAVDVKGQGTTNGSIVQQYAYNGGANQQWTVTSLGNGNYKIIGVQSGRALEVAGAGTANGTGIDIYDYTGASNQQWSLTATSGGYYRLTPANATGSCLDVQHSSLSSGAPLEIYTYGGGNSQQWALQAP